MNGKADALSRRPEYRPREGGSVTQPVQNLFRPGQLQLDDDPCIVCISAISLVILVKSSHLAKDLLDEVRQIAKNDSEYQAIMTAMRDGNEKVDKHLTLSEELLWYNRRLYIPNNMELRLRLTLHDHDSKVAGHWGQAKTLELMTRNWYWPKMEEFVDSYVSSCDPCQHNKSRRHKRFGLLQPLELAYALHCRLTKVCRLHTDLGYRRSFY